MTQYSARETAEATRIVRTIHTYAVRCAATLMATDHRITAGGALNAVVTGGIERMKEGHPRVLHAYFGALKVLGVWRPGDMDYERYLSFVPTGDRLRLTEDRKVAGPAA